MAADVVAVAGQHKTARRESVSVAHMLLLAACFGLATGLVEGIGLLLFHGFPWFKLNSRIPAGVSVPILWISSVVNLCLFLVLGLILSALDRLRSGLPTLRVTLFVFTFLAVVDWTQLTGRIGVVAGLALAVGIGTVLSGRMSQPGVQLWRSAAAVVKWAGLATLLALLATEGGIGLQERITASHLPAAGRTSPNVVVILVDTLRADHLSTYGYARPTSPHLDALAQQGVLFENAISTSSWTLPSHQGLLTGRYPHEHGPLREQPLNERYPTLAEVLDRRGYRTAAFSANTEFFCRRAGFHRGFLHFEDYFYSFADSIYRTFWGRLFFHDYLAGLFGVDELPGRRRAADVNRGLLRWVDQDREKPFFAFLNYIDLHSPYRPERSYRYRFANHDAQEQCSPSLSQRLSPFNRPGEFEQLLDLSPTCFQLQVDAYDGAISYVDNQIANLFSELRQRGLDGNTLVVITSDHGESFREHGLVTHGTSLYREQLRVPLVYYWPGHIPSGMRIDRAITTASLPATILDMAGDKEQQDFPVPSLAQLWRQPEVDPGWPYPLSEMARDLYIPQQYPAYRGWMKSITDPNWHLIVSQADLPELYRYPIDPVEQHNMVGSLEGKAVVNGVETQLWNQVTPPTSSNGHPAIPPIKALVLRITK